MPSTQEPVKITDTSQSILDFAKANHQVKINLRPDHWPDETVKACKGDKVWQIRMALYYGLLMSPWLTDFLKEVKSGDTIVISSQETNGDIVTTVGTVKEIFWIGHNGDDRQYGVHAGIRLNRHYRYGSVWGEIWGNYVLAIAQVRKVARPTSKRDKNGRHFIETVKKYGVV